MRLTQFAEQALHRVAGLYQTSGDTPGLENVRTHLEAIRMGLSQFEAKL